MPLRAEVPPKHTDWTLGIDLSAFNDSTIDWSRVANAVIQTRWGAKKIRFCYARCSLTTGEDTAWRRHYAGAKAAGIVVGPYIALHAEREAGVGAAGVHFATLDRALRAVGYGGADLPPAIDIEKPDNPTPEQVVDIVETALALATMIEVRLGREPIIYSGAYWHWQIAGQRPDLARRLERYALWTPDYDLNDNTKVPAGWDRWLIRQYTSQGRVPGIDGDVDMNRFDGGEAVFATWRARSLTWRSPLVIIPVLLSVLSLVLWALL